LQKHNSKNGKKIYLVSLLIMIFSMAIFANSFYWPYEEFSNRKLLALVIVLFGIIVVPLLSIKIHILSKYIQKILNNIIKTIEKARQNKKRVVFYAGFILFGFGLAYVLTYIVSLLVLRSGFNVRLLYVVLALMGIVVCLIVKWKSVAQKPEKIFAIFALILGLFCIGVTPDRVGVSWDDEIHYARALEISNVFNGIMYEADIKNITDYANNIYGRNGYDRTTDSQYQGQLGASYEEKQWSSHQFSQYGVYSVAYIPSAIGIILGRGLDLSYAGVFNLGRLCNLLMYIFLISLAIKKMQYGKVLIATIGLIPTMMFMASSYSYDPWVVGFTILGFSYFFGELQEDKPLETKDIVIMLGSFAIGCLPKAIYFPMLFPLLFMPKKKFKNATQRKVYYFAIVGISLFLVSTFLLPILVNGAGSGDARGGSDVNSTEQIKFILNNPLTYAKTLIKFELDYVALANSASMLQRFAYVGDGCFYSIVSLMLFVLAFLDRGEHEKNHCIVKGAGLIGCAVAIILSTTALYISFTAVGSNTVAGMQARYMVPTIFPALYSLGVGGTTHRINKNAFVCVPMIIIALTFIANMFKFCVLYY